MIGRHTSDSDPEAGSSALGTSAPAGRDEQTRDVVLSEEQLRVATQSQEAGRVRATKTVETQAVERSVPRGVEHAEMERADVAQGDTGEVLTLEDGSLSIPVFEEQLVIEKRMVVRERVIIRKHTVYEEQQVTAELRRERLDVTTEGDVAVTGDLEDPAGRL